MITRHLVHAALSGGMLLSPITSIAQTPDASWRAFERHFDSLAAERRVVGGAAILVRNGAIVARHHFGLADSGRQQRVNDRTLFHYGSITKTLTAIAVMQLRDRGKLTLDDRITRWIPELRQLHDPWGTIDSITIRMLLSHTAGFQNGTWPYGKGRDWEPFEPTSWAQLVAMMPYQELVFKPGTRWGYSNPAYIYLARVVEAITGDPWESYVQKNIFAPLGMTRSYFNGTPYHLADDRSNNYYVQSDSAARKIVVKENGRDFNPGITIPNGGWNAPLDDLAAYAAFLTNATSGDSARRRLFDVVLKRETLEEMWRPVIRNGGAGTVEASMGLGFFLQRDGNVRLVGHTGSQAGFLSFMWINPETSAAIIVAINTDSNTPSVKPALGDVMTRAVELLRSARP
jgi:CubicO group peptidase (beta-lactamase class C family)